jgi:hypothetical protein
MASPSESIRTAQASIRFVLAKHNGDGADSAAEREYQLNAALGWLDDAMSGAAVSADTLAACKAVLKLGSELDKAGIINDPAINAVRAAIAKAEGR